MSRQSPPPDTHDAFAGLPVRHIRCTGPGSRMAVHISGRLDDRRMPIICLPGYCRNMADYGALVGQFHRLSDKDWPIVLLDLPGRGRSANRREMSQYSTFNDARDVAGIAAALGIERAVFLGQGHGGQVVMALGAGHAHLIAGTILIDASPITDTPGLVRLRDNLNMMANARGREEFLRIARRVLTQAYPGATETELDEIAARTHHVEKNQRVSALFDSALLKRLANIQLEDVFEAQWKLFTALSLAPMMLMRTQLTDQLQRATFERMAELRSDAVQLVIPGQGSPALLAGEDEVGAIADFVQYVSNQTPMRAMVWG